MVAILQPIKSKLREELNQMKLLLTVLSITAILAMILTFTACGKINEIISQGEITNPPRQTHETSSQALKTIIHKKIIIQEWL